MKRSSLVLMALLSAFPARAAGGLALEITVPNYSFEPIQFTAKRAQGARSVPCGGATIELTGRFPALTLKTDADGRAQVTPADIVSRSTTDKPWVAVTATLKCAGGTHEDEFALNKEQFGEASPAAAAAESADAPAPEPPGPLEQAGQLWMKGDYAGALDLLEKTAADPSQSADVRDAALLRQASYLERRAPYLALSKYSEYLQRSEAGREGKNQFYYLHRFDETLNNVIRIANSLYVKPPVPKEAEAHLQAALRKNVGFTKEASESECWMALAKAPWWPKAYVMMGLIHEHTWAYMRASDAHERAKESGARSIDLATARRDSAASYAETATKYYKMAERLDPEFAYAAGTPQRIAQMGGLSSLRSYDPWEELANGALRDGGDGRWGLAYQKLSRAIDLYGATPYLLDLRSWIFANTDKYALALRDLEELLRQDAANASYLARKAACENGLGLHEAAVRDASAAIDKNPSSVYAMVQRGLARRDLGLFQEAIGDFETAAKLEPSQGYYPWQMGRAFHGWRKYPEAIQQYSRAIQLNPAGAYYYFHRGESYRDSGDRRRALQDYRKAAELAPQEPLFAKTLQEFQDAGGMPSGGR